MSNSMVFTALVMGLVGGPHCVAMCGAACAGVARAAGSRSGRALWAFQIGRLIGYSLLGALAGGTVQGLGWLGGQTAFLRPAWTLFHLLAMALGVVLLWQARQPAFVDDWAQRLWRTTRPLMTSLGRSAPWVLGVGWALLPCGLLYSALLVASLSAHALDGALIMAAFAAGSAVSLTIGPWLLLRLRGSGSAAGLSMRLAGAALLLTSGWALWMGLTQPSGLFCS